jgi:hypothetical protein
MPVSVRDEIVASAGVRALEKRIREFERVPAIETQENETRNRVAMDAWAATTL